MRFPNFEDPTVICGLLMLRDKRSDGVFVCYRREDSGYAGRLYDRLRDRFPNRVFLDVRDISLGENFVEKISEAIGASKVLIVVIGKTWLSATDVDGVRRLDKAQDFVRMEVAIALERGVELLPVLLPGAVMPSAEDLPDDIAPLAYRQAREISDVDFDHDVDSISSALAKALGVSRRPRYLRRAAIVYAASALIVVGAVGSYIVNLRSGRLSGQDSAAPSNPSVRPAGPRTTPQSGQGSDANGGAPAVKERRPEAASPKVGDGSTETTSRQSEGNSGMSPTRKQDPSISWKKAWLTIRDRQGLKFGAHGVFAGMIVRPITNREALLKILNRLDLRMDPQLLSKRNKLLHMVESAEEDSGLNALGHRDLSEYYNMIYSSELREALNDLEIAIRDGALSHGVDLGVLTKAREDK